MKALYLIPILFLASSFLTVAQPAPRRDDRSVLTKAITLSGASISLEKTLAEISRQTGVNFSYSSHVLPVQSIISLSLVNQPLEQVLRLLLEERKLTYTVNGNRIIIRRQPAPLTQTIKGTVVDHASKAPIFGANVLVTGVDPALGSTTDEKGNFRIEQVPAGRQSMHISHVGYQALTLPQLLVGTGKELVVSAELTEQVAQMGEVVVTDEANRMEPLNEMTAVSTRLLPISEAKRQASSLRDPARIVSGYAGVTGDDYLENSLVIRGNSSRGLLWRLEGVEIPNPNHFTEEGSASGGVSIISANLLADSDFITGAFPARYGNALSGVLDLRLRNGNAEKREYAVQVGTMGLDVALEGPLKKGWRASYLLNYRYSLFSLLNRVGFVNHLTNQATHFQDATFKINFPTRRLGIFSVFGTGGLSSYAIDSALTTGQNESDVGVLGISHQFQINSSTSIHTVFSLSGTRIGQFRQWAKPGTDSSFHTSGENFAKGYARASVLLYKKWNASHLLEGGFTLSQLSYNFRDKAHGDGISGSHLSLFDDQGKAALVQSYLSWRYRIGEKWTLVSGLHGLYFGLNQRVSFEPRTGVTWQFHPNHSLHAGVGVHSRIEPLQYYFARFHLPGQTPVQYNRRLDFTKARHYVIGYDYRHRPDWLLRTEVYYQDLYQVAVRDDSAGIFSTISVYEGFSNYALVNRGSGTNYGLELSLEKFFSRYYFTGNASLYRATYQTLDQTRRNTPYNGSFTTHLLAGREFKLGKSRGQHQLNINFRTVWNGGKRYIPIDLEASIQQGREVLALDQAYIHRLPDYFRLDLQAAYRLNGKRCTSEWRLDMLNVTNHHSPLKQFFNPQTQQADRLVQAGLYPVMAYRMEF